MWISCARRDAVGELSSPWGYDKLTNTEKEESPIRRISTMTSPDLLGDRVTSVALTPQEIQRYARHLIMPEVAMQGQKRL